MAADSLESTKDPAWPVKVTNAVNQHWQKNNAQKRMLVITRKVIELESAKLGAFGGVSIQPISI
jgi:hypothetical protein